MDPAHQANWQAWAIAEWRAGRVDRARELLQRGVWVAPRSRNACKLFQAWGVLEEREGNVALARQLYKCGVKADPTSETTWLTWAKMEERLENPIRAQELRTLCVQQRAEALVGQSDLSPAAMFGIDSALRPVLTSLAKLLGGQDAAAIAESVSEGSVKYGRLRRADAVGVAAPRLRARRLQVPAEPNHPRGDPHARAHLHQGGAQYSSVPRRLHHHGRRQLHRRSVDIACGDDG